MLPKSSITRAPFDSTLLVATSISTCAPKDLNEILRSVGTMELLLFLLFCHNH